LEKQFCRPVFGVRFLRGWLRRSLDRNPIGWLERRSWSGRLVLWAWLAVVVCVYGFTFSAMSFFMTEFNTLQATLAGLLLLSLTATAAGSFGRERESGVLELLLVTPLSERQIITGRLRGIWGQYLPSVALMAGVWIYAARILNANDSYMPQRTDAWDALWMLSSFVALPIIGLRNSLSFSSYIGAFVATVGFGCAVPLLVVNLPQLWRASELLTGLRAVANWPESQPAGLIFGSAVQLIIALALLLSLHRNLVQRRFARERKTA
jgi:ABC-type Na+ efflux pump permease subunit